MRWTQNIQYTRPGDKGTHKLATKTKMSETKTKHTMYKGTAPTKTCLRDKNLAHGAIYAQRLNNSKT